MTDFAIELITEGVSTDQMVFVVSSMFMKFPNLLLWKIGIEIQDLSMASFKFLSQEDKRVQSTYIT